MVAASPWVIPIFRDVAPDLWSVRSQVVHIEPDPERMRDGIERSIDTPLDRRMPDEGSVPDPELAHREVGRLRGVVGRERELGAMLIREEEELPIAAAYMNGGSIRDTPCYPLSGRNLARRAPCWLDRVLREAEETCPSRALNEEGGGAVWRGITMDLLTREQGAGAEARRPSAARWR